MRSIHGSALLALLAAVSPLAQADKVDKIIEQYMARRHAPAVELLVIDHGKTLKQTAYGFADLEWSVPATKDALFQTGSIGKIFTATGVLALVQDGKIGLEDPLTKFFPDAPDTWKAITVRNLLEHTSGLGDYDNDVDLHKDYSEKELVQLAEHEKPAFEPGTKWVYSNTGFMLLGAIIHKVTGQIYSDFLAQRVFKPAGMTTIRTLNDVELIKNRAHGYDFDTKNFSNQDWVSPGLNSTADGTLYATTSDFIAWTKALDSGSLLPARLQELAWTPSKLADGTVNPYGLGWAIGSRLGSDYVWHNGAWQGFCANYVRYRDGLTVVVMGNLSNLNTSRVVNAVAAQYRHKLNWETATAVPDEGQYLANFKAIWDNLHAAKKDFSTFAGFAETSARGLAPRWASVQARFGSLTKTELIYSKKLGSGYEYAVRLTFDKTTGFVQVRSSDTGKIDSIDFEIRDL